MYPRNVKLFQICVVEVALHQPLVPKAAVDVENPRKKKKTRQTKGRRTHNRIERALNVQKKRKKQKTNGKDSSNNRS